MRGLDVQVDALHQQRPARLRSGGSARRVNGPRRSASRAGLATPGATRRPPRRQREQRARVEQRLHAGHGVAHQQRLASASGGA
jgi:hypothetical protein